MHAAQGSSKFLEYQPKNMSPQLEVGIFSRGRAI